MNVLVSVAIALAVLLPGAASAHHTEATANQVVDKNCHHHEYPVGETTWVTSRAFGSGFFIPRRP